MPYNAAAHRETMKLTGKLAVFQSGHRSWTLYRIFEDYDDPLAVKHSVVGVFDNEAEAEREQRRLMREEEAKQLLTLTDEEDDE